MSPTLRRDAVVLLGALAAIGVATELLRSIPGISTTTVALVLLLIVLGTATFARLRVAVGRLNSATAAAGGLIRAGELTIDPDTYAAKLKGRPLDLTYKEFELLKFLAQHPGRVFTRQQLLQEVWGYDYFGGTRTVDVHVRRLRAKLGSEYESMIGTVRQVGYKLVLPPQAKPQALAGEWEMLSAVATEVDPPPVCEALGHG